MNWAWIYVGAVYAAAVFLARRSGVDLPRRVALFFFAAVLVFFFQPLTQDYVASQEDVLNTLPPWHFVVDDKDAINGEMNDIPLQHTVWGHQARESWKALRFPLWNHYNGAGYPLLANGQSSAMSPIRLVNIPVPTRYFMAAEAATKILIALTFAFLFLRGRGYGELPSVIGACVFGFGGFLHSWLHFPHVTTAVWLPAVLYLIDRIAAPEVQPRSRVFAREKWGLFAAAALVWATILYGGHPETASHIFFLALLYLLWIVFVEKRTTWRLFLTLGGAMTVAAMLSAPFLLPFLEALPKSQRYQALKVMPYEAKAMPYTDLDCMIVLFQGHFFGRAPFEKPWGPIVAEPIGGFAGVLGIVGFVALIAHIVRRRRWRSPETFFVLATVIVYGVIDGWPFIGDAIHAVLPVVAHARFRLLFIMLMAIQAAAVVHYTTVGGTTTSDDAASPFPGTDPSSGLRPPSPLAEGRRDLDGSLSPLSPERGAGQGEGLSSQRMTWEPLVGVGVVVAMLIALFTLHYFPDDARRTTALLTTGRSVIVLACALLLMTRWRKWAMLALLVGVVNELWPVTRNWNPPLPGDKFYPRTPYLRAVLGLRNRHAANDPFRVVGLGPMVYPNTNAMYGIEDIRAHDPMSNDRYMGFLRLTADYKTGPENYHPWYENGDASVLNFLNVHYLYSDPWYNPPDPERWKLIYEGMDGRIFENRDALPRFFAVRNVVIEFRDLQFIERLKSHNDWANTALLDELKLETQQMHDDFFDPRPADSPLATAKIVSAAPTSYQLQVSAPRWSLVASSIPWWPGWKVTRNGQRVDPIRVNGAFVGFAVPPGQSNVRVDYSPWTWWVGVGLAGLGVVVLVVMSQRSSRIGS
jgi:hypothetical protein